MLLSLGRPWKALLAFLMPLIYYWCCIDCNNGYFTLNPWLSAIKAIQHIHHHEIFFFFFLWYWIWTYRLMLAMQELYHLSYSASSPPWHLIKMQILLVYLGWSLRFCSSNRLLDYADASSPGTHIMLEGPRIFLEQRKGSKE
jgi:hypothetical protein